MWTSDWSISCTSAIAYTCNTWHCGALALHVTACLAFQFAHFNEIHSERKGHRNTLSHSPPPFLVRPKFCTRQPAVLAESTIVRITELSPGPDIDLGSLVLRMCGLQWRIRDSSQEEALRWLEQRLMSRKGGLGVTPRKFWTFTSKYLHFGCFWESWAVFDWANLDPDQPDPHDLCMFDWANPDPDQTHSDPSKQGWLDPPYSFLPKWYFFAKITEEGTARVGTMATGSFSCHFLFVSMTTQICMQARSFGFWRIREIQWIDLDLDSTNRTRPWRLLKRGGGGMPPLLHSKSATGH